ncbi:serine/threonine-protein kinase [Amycolatopsis solani]|uniref:serine/threonine-protein kinase n=2 Tax=Amycolatopsis solani TaxID=3028615 RepID=UPI00296F4EC1|nr:serine/threonine-protein kinase [Amycolatopsis sp. MEP2-6]
MTNEPPHVLAGRYEVGPLLGKGATARVHRAVDRELGREVAVKVYDRHAVAVDQLRRARERTLLASIDHPRVVTLYDSGTEGDRPYLVMQLVDGENLAERLLAGPFTTGEVSELGVRLAEALAHVHARGIVHRDLKPANILLGAGGPLITDFGIAHALDSTHITGTGLVTGTAAYLAPEQILGDPAGPAADIYALGLILLECLTAQREFPGTLAESALARLNRAPRVPGSTPEPLAHTLRLMTAKDPADRPGAEQLPRLLREPAAATTAAIATIASAAAVTTASAAGTSANAAVAGTAATAGAPVKPASAWRRALKPTAPGAAAAAAAATAAAADTAATAPATAATDAAATAAPVTPASARRRALTAGGVLATAAAGLLTVVLARPADPASSPAEPAAAAPPSTSAAAPSGVTLPPATAVVVATPQSSKRVSVGVAAAAGPKEQPGKGPAKREGGPPKPDGGPRPEAGKHPGKR